MKPVISEHGEERLTYGKYLAGFAGSVFLTIAAYLLVMHGTAGSAGLELLLALLAVTQFLVQMFLFLHINEGRGSRWKLVTAFMMLVTIFILVAGSLWVMHNMDGRMILTPEQQDQYIQSQDNF